MIATVLRKLQFALQHDADVINNYYLRSDVIIVNYIRVITFCVYFVGIQLRVNVQYSSW